MPAFELPDGEGKPVRSADLLGHGPLVLFFYPKDMTPVCTAEACGFRDRREDFLAQQATVIGISNDPPSSHAAFTAKHGLTFPLLSDEGGKVAAQFGVSALFGLMRGRETFVFDGQGILRGHVAALLSADKHVTGALEAVRGLRAAAT